MGNAKNIGVLTSGGDAPGMNAAIHSVVRMAVHNGLNVFGIKRGYQGLIEDDLVELKSKDVSEIIDDGGTILYTARSTDMMKPEGVAKAAANLTKHKIDALIVIGGDGSFRGALELSKLGINVIGVPATIDMDISCSEYTIGFDTAVNTAMEAIDRVRDTSTSHMRCSIVEVMGRKAGYIALWCGIANGAEAVLIPEKYRGEEDIKAICDYIKTSRQQGKTHYLVVNAEGIGHSAALAKRIEEETGVDTNTTVLGYMQRGGKPTAKDRYFASVMGAAAVQQILYGKKNRIIVTDGGGEIRDIDISEALNMKKQISEDLWNICLQLRR